MKGLTSNPGAKILAHLLVLLTAFLGVQHLKLLRQSAALRLLPSSLRDLSAACCRPLPGGLCCSGPFCIWLPSGWCVPRARARLLRCQWLLRRWLLLWCLVSSHWLSLGRLWGRCSSWLPSCILLHKACWLTCWGWWLSLSTCDGAREGLPICLGRQGPTGHSLPSSLATRSLGRLCPVLTWRLLALLTLLCFLDARLLLLKPLLLLRLACACAQAS